MSIKKLPNDDRNKEKNPISLDVFIAILVSLAFLACAFLLVNYFVREYYSQDKQAAQALEQTAAQTQQTARTFPQTSNTGEVLNIYGEPLKEPKPRYIPDLEEETSAEDEKKASGKDKAIYLEAIDNSNVHTEAGQDYPSIDVTEIGEKCKYLGINEYGWLYVETEDGNKGYVYRTHFANAEDATD